jgi:tricarboxylate carrier
MMLRLARAGTAVSIAAVAARAQSSSCTASTSRIRPSEELPSHAASTSRDPPFSKDSPSRFDLTTYAGRACHFVDLLGDLSTLFVTKTAVAEHKALLNAWDAGTPGLDNSALWRARKVVDATCHPLTGELIPAPFRFSAFAPANLVICFGMLRPNPTLAQSAFWQWANQSYNALVNRANSAAGGEDAGGEDAAGEALGAYVAATSSAVAICLGLQAAAKWSTMGSTRGTQLVRLTVPMLAVAVSANVNLVLVRRRELDEGVEVTTADGTRLGSSQCAASRALLECGLTRVLWTFLLLTATPLCASAAFATLPSRLVSSAGGRTATELAVSFGTIWLSVPLAIACFPQRESMPLEQLEPSVREAAESMGYRGKAWFNKGL